jgi:hypothetical protein
MCLKQSFALLLLLASSARPADAAIVPLSPTNGAADVVQFPTLTVSASASSTNNLTVTFYGRPKNANPDFTLIALPDTQYYTASLFGGTPAMFTSQTDWIVAHRSDSNIVYVAHEGDITDFGAIDSEWTPATNAMYRLENPATTGLSNGIPYGVLAGNHDLYGGLSEYSRYFGVSHFQGRSYFGGAYDANNLNHYDLFTAGGLDFIVICLSYDSSATSSNAPVYLWAKNLLQTNANRRAIVVSHDILSAGNPAPFDPQGQAIYNALKGCSNLFLMLCGHNHYEARRADTNNDHVVYTLMADYQDRANGGDGLLRIQRFSPASNVIHILTYSPWTGSYETDSDSQFDLAYDLGFPWTALATNTGVVSSSNTSAAWPGLLAGKPYEWYVTASDGITTNSGPVWSFTTQAAPAPWLSVVPGSMTNGLITITWTSVGGLRYRVSYCAGDAAGGYTGIFTDIVRSATEEIDPSLPGTASTQSFTDPVPLSANKARYYRIRIVQ